MTERRPRQRRPHDVLSPRKVLVLGLGGLLAVLAMAWAGYRAPNEIPGRSYYTVTAQLRDAANLTVHTQVKSAGRLVGQVLNPRFVDGRPTVDLQLDPDLRPLPRSTRVRVRPRSAVGAPYVELDLGRGGPPLADGEPIRVARTSAAVPLDTALSTLDPTTRRRTQQLLDVLGRGVAGRGEQVRDVLPEVLPIERDVQRATALLRRDPDALGGLVRGGAGTFGALDAVRSELTGGFAVGTRIFSAIDQRPELQAALDALPGTLRDVRGGLRGSEPVLAALERFARRARPVLDDAPVALRATTTMLRVGARTVEPLRRTLRLADAAVPPTLGLLADARPVLPRLDRAMDDARPVVDELAPRRCDMLLLTRNWASMIGAGNADGNVLRLVVASLGANALAGVQNPDWRDPGSAKNPYPEPCQSVEDPKTLRGSR